MSEQLKGIFINCPYDDEYKQFFEEIVFLCYYFHFEPHFASEDISSGSRQDKIVGLIQNTKYGIHDISRVSISHISGLPRFNMPFELGMDVMHCVETDKDKKLLVLDGKKGNYEKLLSDIKCADIEAHENKPENLFKILRTFFLQIGSYKDVKSPNYILNYYQMTFSVWLKENLRECDIDMASGISMLEYKQKVCQFFRDNYGDGAQCN